MAQSMRDQTPDSENHHVAKEHVSGQPVGERHCGNRRSASCGAGGAFCTRQGVHCLSLSQCAPAGRLVVGDATHQLPTVILAARFSRLSAEPRTGFNCFSEVETQNARKHSGFRVTKIENASLPRCFSDRPGQTATRPLFQLFQAAGPHGWAGCASPSDGSPAATLRPSRASAIQFVNTFSAAAAQLLRGWAPGSSPGK